MSIQPDGIKFDRPKVKRSAAFFLLLGLLELTFSFFLYLSLAGHIFAPQSSEAAPGVPQLLSFQGRLTDTSGNPLGGVGTPYCFRYSIYDAQSGGSQLWPAGTPGTSTTTVVDGVYSDQIGRVDALTHDFIATSTIFLQVDVNTVTSTCSGAWESLTPRQQLTSAPFAQSAENIYGNAIRTPTSTKVQIGTGAGVASGQTLFSLDVVNASESIGGTCNNNNGTMWYNSTLSRALVCENNTINVLSNSSTTIAGIGTNGAAPITVGNIVFSNSNGVSFGQNGSTITASAAGGGGGAPTASIYLNDPGAGVASANFGFSNATLALFPLNGGKVFPFNMTLNTLIIGMSGNITATSASSSNTQRFSVGFYTLNGSTLSLAFSASSSFAVAAGTSNSALSHGPRNLSFHSSLFNVQPTFSQTNYWVGFWQRSSNYAAQGSLMGHRFHTSNQRSGNFGVSAATATTLKLFPFWGHYGTSFSTAMPDSIQKSQVSGASAWSGFTPYILFNSYDTTF